MKILDLKSLARIVVSAGISAGVMLLVAAGDARGQDGGYGYYPGPGADFAGTPPSAFDGLEYDLFELGYRYMVFDGDKSFLDDGHAVSLDLSLDLLWLFFVEAKVLYGSTNADLDADKFFDLDESGNYTEVRMGVGGHVPVGDRFHVVASGGFFYENQDLSGDVLDDVDGIVDGGGFYLKPGIRVLLTDSLEAGAFVDYTKLGDAGDGNIGFSGSLTYRLTDAIGISGSAQFKEDVSTFGAGLRLSW